MRRVNAPGGPNGLRYEVLLDSLPSDLQDRYRSENPTQLLPVAAAAPPLPAPRMSFARGASNDWNWRFEMIRPALAHPPRSRARAQAIRVFARQFGVSETSIRRYIRNHEDCGIAGLERKARADKGRRLVIVSRRWDQAIPFDEAAKRDIAAKLLRKVRSLWAAGAPGWRHIQRLATIYLARLTREVGLDLPELELLKLCAVPRAFISRERKYRTLATKDKDAKAFSDNLPRIRRDYSGIEPLELVIGDVHPVDIYFLRPDGSVQPIRLIGWLDAHTNRFVGHVLFPEKGTGVRMEHAAASFAYMVLAWGMPKALLLDNGSEYNIFALVKDAMALAKGYEDDLRTLIKALPHSPQSKKIEAIFGVIERQFLSTLPGYIAGERMKKKTQNVGKEPDPFPGTREQLNAAIMQRIAAYNATPQDGLGGLSPNQAWGRSTEAGWRPTVTDMAALQTAFAREDVARISGGKFTYKRRVYTHDEICARPHLDRVLLRVPVFGDARPGVYDPEGTFICHAREDIPYGVLDRDGARESSRRKKLARRGAEALRADIDPVDFDAETAAFLAMNPAPARPEPAALIGLSDELARDAECRRKLSPKQERDAGLDRQRERYALIGRRNRAVGTGG